jgi:hypothetical protein
MGLLHRLLGKPTIADFAAEMIQAFREAGDKSDLRFDAAGNRIIRSDAGSDSNSNLSRLYDLSLREPRSRRPD